MDTTRALRSRRCAAASASRGGFSLIELNTAVIVAGILTLSVGAAMVAGMNMSVAAKRTVALKQDAAYALRYIQRRVRGLYNDELLVDTTEDGDPILVLYPDTADEAYVVRDGADLDYIDSAGHTTVLISGTLSAATFTITTGQNATDKLLTVSLSMNDEGKTLALPDSVTLIRNRP